MRVIGRNNKSEPIIDWNTGTPSPAAPVVDTGLLVAMADADAVEMAADPVKKAALVVKDGSYFNGSNAPETKTKTSALLLGWKRDAPDSGIIGGAVVTVNGGIGHTALGGSITISSAYGGAVFEVPDAALTFSTEAANAGNRNSNSNSGVVEKRSGSSLSGSGGDIAIKVGSGNNDTKVAFSVTTCLSSASDDRAMSITAKAGRSTTNNSCFYTLRILLLHASYLVCFLFGVQANETQPFPTSDGMVSLCLMLYNDTVLHRTQ